MSTLVKTDLNSMLSSLEADLKASKKSDQAVVLGEFSTAIHDFLENVMNGNATSITSNASLTESKITTELPESSNNFGTRTDKQVRTGVSMGFTRNLGNFNSARFDVNVETYTDDNEQGVQDGLARAGKLAEAELMRRQSEIASTLKGTDK